MIWGVDIFIVVSAYVVISAVALFATAYIGTYYEIKSDPFKFGYKQGRYDIEYVFMLTMLLGFIPIVTNVVCAWGTINAIKFYKSYKTMYHDIYVYQSSTGNQPPKRCWIKRNYPESGYSYVLVESSEKDPDYVHAHHTDVVRVKEEDYIELKLTGNLESLFDGRDTDDL